MNVYTLHHICIFNDGGIFVIKIYKNILNHCISYIIICIR